MIKHDLLAVGLRRKERRTTYRADRQSETGMEPTPASPLITSAGASTTSQGTEPTGTVDQKTALSHGHALLAATVLGRLSDADTHTATEQWRAKTDTLALGFWNNATTAFSNQPTSPNTATKPASSNTATMPTGSTTATTPSEHTERRHTSTGAATRHGKAASVLVLQRPRVRLLTVGQVPVGKTTRQQAVAQTKP